MKLFIVYFAAALIGWHSYLFMIADAPAYKAVNVAVVFMWIFLVHYYHTRKD